jgi:hypothetical protein
MSTFFQFSNFESCCYCKTVCLTLGSKAYGTLVETVGQLEEAKTGYWVRGITMAGTALAFMVAVNILLKQPEPRREASQKKYGCLQNNRDRC